MQYLREFPPSVQPALEGIIVTADLEHQLTGHHGGISAHDAALKYIVDTYCRLAAVLCQSVECGHLAYLDLTPSLERLRNSLVRDVYERANLSHWEMCAVGPRGNELTWSAFKRRVAETLDRSPEWRAVQQKRVALATNGRTAVTSATGDAIEIQPSITSPPVPQSFEAPPRPPTPVKTIFIAPAPPTVGYRVQPSNAHPPIHRVGSTVSSTPVNKPAETTAVPSGAQGTPSTDLLVAAPISVLSVVEDSRIGGPKFAEWLKASMATRGLTMNGLQRIPPHIDRKTIRKVRKGGKVLPPTVAKFAKAFGVDISQIPTD